MTLCALILCGGRSTRMGTDKALVEVAGRPLLAHVIDRLRPVCPDLRLAAGPQTRYTEFGVPVVLDRFHDVGPIAGLHAGLSALSAERAFVTACDMPFVAPAVVRRLFELADGFDAAAPRVAGRFEPMCAVYGKSCLPAIEAAVAAGRFGLIALLERVRVRTVSEAELRELDPELSSLRNLNTPTEFDELRARNP
jgi:molybdopterin-guanine dinucleotide biosynthesis protein A